MSILGLGKFNYACGLDGKYCLLEGCGICYRLKQAAPELLAELKILQNNRGKFGLFEDEQRVLALIARVEGND